MDIAARIRAHFAESAELKLAAAEAMAPQIARAAALMTDCLLADGKLLACGNGGSASDAQHFAAEMVGRFERERKVEAASVNSCRPRMSTCAYRTPARRGFRKSTS